MSAPLTECVYESGQTVRLHSGGPVMTVNRVDQSSGLLACLWFTEWTLRSAWLDPRVIVAAPPADGTDAEAAPDEQSEPYWEPEPLYDEPDSDGPWIDSDTQAEMDLISEELASDSEDYARSEGDGWFYSDDDPPEY